MYLAINYSPAAAGLIKSGQIDVDYFKTPDWDWIVNEARQLKPVAVHFTLEAGNDSLGEVDWEKIDRMAEETGTPYINLHLDSRQSYYPGFAIDTKKESEVQLVKKLIISDVLRAVKHFGAERVILENSPYQARQGNTMRLCVEPNIINQVIEETGCGFLLDISHAIITSRYFHLPPDEYISQLPVINLKELHFAGIHRNTATGEWMDHLSIQQEDWIWLDWVVNRIHNGDWSNPRLLAFEYGGVGEPFEWRSDPAIIAQQVPELRDHINLLQN